MKTKTESELYYRKASLDCGDGLIYGETGPTLAIVPNNNDIGYLFAAAPELLQAVKDALLLAELYDQEGAAVDNYRRVIAKAEPQK